MIKIIRHGNGPMGRVVRVGEPISFMRGYVAPTSQPVVTPAPVTQPAPLVTGGKK